MTDCFFALKLVPFGGLALAGNVALRGAVGKIAPPIFVVSCLAYAAVCGVFASAFIDLYLRATNGTMETLPYLNLSAVAGGLALVGTCIADVAMMKRRARIEHIARREFCTWDCPDHRETMSSPSTSVAVRSR